MNATTDVAALERDASALVNKALLHVKLYHTFFGALVERLRVKCDHRHPTMYTDAIVLGYSPKFVMSLRFEHLVYILVHEVMHCALGHSFRRGVRDPKLWNEACDHVINNTLNRDPVLRGMFPGDGLCDPRFDGMAADQVYAILKQEQQAQQQPQEGAGEQEKQELDGATGNWGDCCDAGASGEPMDDPAEAEEEEKDDGSESQPSKDAKPKEESDDESEAYASGDDGEEDEDDDEGDGGSADDSDDADEEEEEDSETESSGAGDEDDSELEEEGESDERESSEVPQDESATAGSGDGGSIGEPDGSLSDGSSSLDDAQKAALQHEWEQAVMTAQLAAGGDIDASMARAIGSSQVERKDFRAYVDEFAHATCAMEDSWNRPNRRYPDTYLPSRCAPGVKTMVVGIDTSGSVGADDLALMQQAAQGVLDDFGLKELHAVYCDTQIRGVDVFRSGDEVKLQPKGGGGTRFHPVFRYALELSEQGEDIAGVIYLTDLMGSVQDAEDFQQLQTLWVDVAKFGKTYQRNAPGGLGRVVSVYL